MRIQYQAGIIALESLNHYLLALVNPGFCAWRLVQIEHGSLEKLSIHAKQAKVAIAIDASQLLAWHEEFPRSMNANAILHYLKQNKAELFLAPNDHLTLSKQASASNQSHTWRDESWRCPYA